ncbi:MAG TPA: EamA family transporter [Dongiaceae bacterium]|nr:EamA family transporter [Dongiaceae bacterium]
MTANNAVSPRAIDRIPPHAYFVVSALFHYLGPSFAVLLFAAIEPLGVAWLRIASAAIVFALWRRPLRYLRRAAARERWLIVAMAATLAAMNGCFYLAIDRLPLATVGAIEFLGPIGLAALGLTGTFSAAAGIGSASKARPARRRQRNFVALSLAIAGVWMLTDARWVAEPVGYLYAFANCGLFVLYVVLGHRLAAQGGAGGIERLAAAMLVATVFALPFGIEQAMPAFRDPLLLGAGIGIGISSSVIPYVCDQLAMARLPRATFALMLALLPATAALIGIAVLRQIPTHAEMIGIALVIAGVALHRAEREH